MKKTPKSVQQLEEFVRQRHAMLMKMRHEMPVNCTRMLQIIHKFSARDFTDYLKIKKQLVQRIWFKESDEARIIL